MNGNTELAGRDALQAIDAFVLEALADTTISEHEFSRIVGAAISAIQSITRILPTNPLTEVSARRVNRADAPTPPSPPSQGGGDNSQPLPGN